MSLPFESGTNLRQHGRTSLKCEVALDCKTGDETILGLRCETADISQGGMSLESPQQFVPDSKLIVRSEALKIAYLSTVRYCRWEKSLYRVGVEFVAQTASLAKDQSGIVDLYAMLRLNRNVDAESIDRVYKTLARRYHPDNQETGDAEAFLCLNEAYHLLSDPARRQAYDREWDRQRERPTPILERRDLFIGIDGEQNRRFAILCLLYRQRMTDFQSPGFSRLDLEHMTGCTPGEIGFALWYLIEKALVKASNDSSFSITGLGIDHVEQHRADHQEPVRLIEAGSRPSILIN